MTDTPERAIGEAEEWMQSAIDKLPRVTLNSRAACVCCGEAIHAIIRANDAVTLKFDQKKTTRHDDAPILFSNLIEQNKLPDEDKRFLPLLQQTTMHKSGADYGKETFGHKEAQYFVKEGQEFIATMKKRLGPPA